MSLEKQLSDLTAAVTALTEAIRESRTRGIQNAPAQAAPQAPAPQAAVPALHLVQPAAAAPAVAPAAVPPPVPAAGAPGAQMPPLPAFGGAPVPGHIPAQAQTVAAAPFTDHRGMIVWLQDVYKALGQAKGMQIQGILQAMGCNNVNDVKPEQFNDLFARVEALRAA